MLKFTEAIDTIQFNEYKNKRIVISSTDNGHVRFQIPRLYMPFGVSGFTPEVGPTKYNLDFSLTGYDEEGGYVKKFYETIQAIESKVIDEVEKQSEAIFGKVTPRDELETMFNSNLKEGQGGHPPKFRVKVDTDMHERMRATVYNADRQRLEDDIAHGLYSRNSGRAIIEMGSVYFLNRKFGVVWKLHQLMVFEPERLKGFQFSDVA